MSTLLWLLTEAGLVLCWLVTPWAPAPWLALCWLMAPLAGWLALLLTRKRSQVRLTCPVTAEKGKPFSVTAEVRQGVPFGRGRLTVSVENTVTGETHREKLTLHQGRGAWQVQSACCGCLVMQAAELVLWDLLGVLPVRIPCTVQGRTCVMPDTFPIEADPVSAISRQTDCEEYARTSEAATLRRPFRSGNTSPATVCGRSTGSSPPRQDATWCGMRPSRWITD